MKALLKKYRAELELEDVGGYSPDYRIVANMSSLYDADHNCLREYVEIDFGKYLSGVDK